MKHCSQHAKHQVSRTSSAFIIMVVFFMISGGILVLLIFSNKVIHVALCLSEFPSHPFLLQCTSARRLSSWTWPRTARSLSCTEVELPTKVEAMERPLGAGCHTHWTWHCWGSTQRKQEEFLFCTFIICSSTSFVLIFPLNTADRGRQVATVAWIG